MSELQAHHTRTVKLAFVQCACHTGKKLLLQITIDYGNRDADTDFRFWFIVWFYFTLVLHNIVWFLVPISRGGKTRFAPPLRTPMKVVHCIS